MPRRAAITPNKSLHTAIPADIAARMEILLYSDVEGRIPKDAISTLITKLLREYFEHKTLDLGPFMDSLPGVHQVTGPVPTLSALIFKLKGESK